MLRHLRPERSGKADREARRAVCRLAEGLHRRAAAGRHAGRLERDDGLRRALGANGREYVRVEYGWPRVLERFEVAFAGWGVGRG